VHGSIAWASARAWLAAALLEGGQAQRALALLEHAQSHIGPKDSLSSVRHLEVLRYQALALLELDRAAEAAALLDRLLAEHGPDNPLLAGLLHKARALVALRQNDMASFQVHLARVRAHFSATQNPSLMAQTERLVSMGLRTRTPVWQVLDEPLGVDTGRLDTHMRHLVSEIGAAPDARETALGALIQETRARAGYLYLFEGGMLCRVAADGPGATPEQERELERRIEQAERETARFPRDSADAFHEHRSMLIDSEPLEAELLTAAGPQLAVLRAAGDDDERVVIGGAILEPAIGGGLAPRPEVLDAIARAIHSRTQTTTVD
jgi:tetratricopeptide (TPR) repeat protein